MDTGQLIEQACERVGSTDFGPTGWQEPLEVLVTAMNTEADLNELGEAVTAFRIVEFLVTRLEVEQCLREHPEISDQVIERPVFGLGLPRTGSTALSFMLAEDVEHRSLRTWEAGKPVPPPETATQHSDPRIAVAEAEISVINQMFPDFRGMLPTSGTGPQECLVLMALDFRSQMFEATAKIPSYSEYLSTCDFTTTYRYHRRVLQLLQWKCPPHRWWLKTPAHMQHITELDAVYPDAEFIMTHRDITKVIPSVCALMTALSAPMTDTPYPDYTGDLTTRQWEESLHRLLDFRDAGNEHRFHDVQFSDVQADPVGAIRELYASLHEELHPETAKKMSLWWAQNSADRAGQRRYDAAEFGLDLDDVRSRFAFYGNRFTPEA
jgi:hypothetical protein